MRKVLNGDADKMIDDVVLSSLPEIGFSHQLKRVCSSAPQGCCTYVSEKIDKRVHLAYNEFLKQTIEHEKKKKQLQTETNNTKLLASLKGQVVDAQLGHHKDNQST